MGGHAFKKHQVSSIAFLCRVLCFIQIGKNYLCRVNLSVPDGLHRQEDTPMKLVILPLENNELY